MSEQNSLKNITLNTDGASDADAGPGGWAVVPRFGAYVRAPAAEIYRWRLACSYRGGMKLRQAQTWRCGDEFVRIVDLQRLEVGYKTFKDVKSGAGTHQRTSKKDFCRMLKNATPVTGATDPSQA